MPPTADDVLTALRQLPRAEQDIFIKNGAKDIQLLHDKLVAGVATVSAPAASANSSASCVDQWLTDARDGYCVEAQLNQDCEHDDQGSFALTPGQTSSWQHAVAACARHCERCQRCQHMSVSRVHADCTWSYGPCEPRTGVAGFRTAPFRCAHRAEQRRAYMDDSAEPPRGLNRAPLEAVSTSPLWLAIGVVVPPGVVVVPSHEELLAARRTKADVAGLRFMHQSLVSRLNGTVAWQWVTAEAKHEADPRFTVVACRDGPFTMPSEDDRVTAIASACACSKPRSAAQTLN